METATNIQTSLQEIFDKVVAHARKQKCASVDFCWDINISSGCKYRNSTGNACFVGALIKDEYYNKSIEGVPFPDFGVKQNEKHALLLNSLYESGIKYIKSKPVRKLIKEFQRVHDAAAEYHTSFLERVESNFVNIAAKYNLTYKEPNYESN